MTNIGYFTPLDESENKLYYVLAYPDREARKKSWSSFLADRDWLAAKQVSEKDGKLVTAVETTFLHSTDYSPQLKSPVDNGPRIFELRTYTCTPGNLARLHERFRDHTMNLFANHGMTNLVYWTLDADQPAANDTLVYLLTHKSKIARDANFEAFRQDPMWITVKAKDTIAPFSNPPLHQDRSRSVPRIAQSPRPDGQPGCNVPCRRIYRPGRVGLQTAHRRPR
jgi:hypothetical protein